MSLQLLTADEVARCVPHDDDERGFGALATPSGNLPLKLLNVHAKVTGLVAETTVRQTFVNTLGTPLEATYIFPLPDRAAVSRFRFEVGERVIEGTLKERGEARREYDEAIASGHRAAITEEERPGVFTMRVGNLMPGEEASVHLTLSGPVTFSDGEATFQFPLVVAPRYIPGSPLAGDQVGDGTQLDTDAVPDASRISPPVLLPGFPNPVRLGLTVEIDPAGVALGEVKSSLHAVSEAAQGSGVIVRIQPGERLDRDFILRWALGSDAVQTALTLHPDADPQGQVAGGTFQLTLVPPAGLTKTVRPRDVVFVLDRSGSMGGWKMVAARRACARMLDSLTDQDRFGVLAFDHSVERPARLAARGLTPASDRNRFRAVEFLAGLEARGGTEMAGPLSEAVDDLLASGGEARDQVLILITDGQVGNEDQILRTLGSRLANLRVFTLGIDRAVNAGFLKRLAATGGGYCELVESEDRLDDVMDKVHRRIGTPLLTHLTLAGAGLELIPEETAPARLPDLFAGTPIRILGRYRGASEGGLTVAARDGVGMAWSETLTGQRRETLAPTRVWARGRIRDLEDRYAVTSDRSLVPTITQTSLRFGVLCRFTSFVAVDRSEVVNAGGELHRVTQAVEQPEGWAGPAEREKAEAFGGKGKAKKRGRRLSKTASKAKDVSRSILDGLTMGASMPAPAAPANGAPAGPPPEIVQQCAEESLAKNTPLARPPAPRKVPAGRLREEDADERRDATPDTTDALRAYRRRIEDLLEVLTGDGQAVLEQRQRALAKLALLLETLLEDLRSVGIDPARLRPLLDLARGLEVVRQGPLDAGELQRLEDQARDVVEAFLAHPPAGAASGASRDGGFWF